MNPEPPDNQWVSDSGAKRSKKMPRYDLIPQSVMKCLADRLQLGAEKYGEWNWQIGARAFDEVFLTDCLNHAQHHLSSLMNGDFSEEDEWGHLGAIVFGCMVVAEAYARNDNRCNAKIVESFTHGLKVEVKSTEGGGAK